MIPKIVIVGRPNVGKSSLLNLLAKRTISIVDAMAGVTRDRISAVVELPFTSRHERPRTVEFIDTGGHGIVDTQNLTEHVERQITIGLREADLILFVVDAQTGVLPLDQEVARLLRTYVAANKPVLLVANKVDGPSLEPAAFEAMKLGFGEPVVVSATSKHNRIELIEAIRDRLDQLPPRPDESAETSGDPPVLVAIVGKRNAGKSTLVNALAGEERVIVSAIEGTTRDSVDVRLNLDGHAITAIDTAGVRKRKSVKEDIEYYSLHRALRSIRRADVALLLIDASVPVSTVDVKLAAEVLKHYKPCVLVVNKWDLAERQYTQEQYLEYLDKAVKGLAFAPIAFISAAQGQGLRELMAMALNLHEQAGARVTTGQLNRAVEAILAERTPVSKAGKRPRVYYVTQTASNPPTVALFVNNPELIDNNYQRFFLNRLRDKVPYSEVPIKLLIRGRRAVPEGVEVKEG